MNHTYLGRIPFAKALELEDQAFAAVRAGAPGRVLGFESEPTITLGVRGRAEDVQWPAERLAERGFKVYRLERGGQATLHHPGQLVIFPILPIQHIGARAWVQLLLETSRLCVEKYGKYVKCRPGQPGLYSEIGKMVSVGVRVRQGISTHGVAINVTNDLSDFQCIRPCGVSGAPMDRVGEGVALEAVFLDWVELLNGLTSSPNLPNLECSSPDVRL